MCQVLLYNISTHYPLRGKLSKKDGKCDKGWESYDNERQWKYIRNSKSKKIRLNVPTALENDLSIDLKKLLAGVVDKQDIE